MYGLRKMSHKWHAPIQATMCLLSMQSDNAGQIRKQMPKATAVQPRPIHRRLQTPTTRYNQTGLLLLNPKISCAVMLRLFIKTNHTGDDMTTPRQYHHGQTSTYGRTQSAYREHAPYIMHDDFTSLYGQSLLILSVMNG